MHKRVRASRLGILVVLGLGALVAATAVVAASSTPWPMGGQNISNTRATPISAINPQNVKQLKVKWTFHTHGDVSATPAVVDGAVYFPDWGGYINKVDASTGALIWQRTIDSYLTAYGASHDNARTSPAVVGNTVYIGDQQVGRLLAINASTGDLRWSAYLGGGNFFPLLTQSPVVANGVVYEGTASAEEGNVAFIPQYACCHDRGFFAAVDATTGQVLWQKPMTVPGYSGAGVWGSTAAVDPSTSTVYLATGNNYSMPQSAIDCKDAGGPPSQCLDPNNYVDSVLALKTTDGTIKWADKLEPGYDDWNVSCIFNQYNPGGCPANPGPDYDFGSGPMLFTTSKGQKLIGAGQKSGDFWVLDAATGNVLHRTHGGPGSTLGGIEWGSSVDNKYAYVAEANANFQSYTGAGGQTIPAGSWAAIDPGTGQVAWQTPDPGNYMTLGPTSVANGVVYAGSMAGGMYALDAQNGKILWSFQGEGSSNAGAAIVDGTVYWGNGYAHLNAPGFQLGTESHTFYAFSVNGN
jgi:polyvinyl alcohol dehydrogenase (cytochrome)